MDSGSSTCFLCDVEMVGYGARASLPPGAEVMTAEYFRANLPAAWRDDYLRLLGVAQEFARERSGDIRAVV